MKENKADARCLMASGFMLFGALASFIAGLIFLGPRWEGLAPVGSASFFIGGVCYLWFAFRLWRGNRQPVANLMEFAKGNFLLVLSILVFFFNYGKYVGNFGDDPDPNFFVKLFSVLLMLGALFIFIEAIARLRGVRKAKQIAAAGEDK